MLRSKNKVKGFTLIELIMVIVLLGILAATALPRFADMTGEAETAAFDGVRGAFSAGVSIARAQWLVEGTGAAGNINLDGATVAMNANGWPDIPNGTETECTDLYTNLISGDVPSNWTVSGDAAGSCMFVDGTGNNGFRYNSATGDISLGTSFP